MRILVLMSGLLGSSPLLLGSGGTTTEGDAQRKFKQYAQFADPVTRGLDALRRAAKDPAKAAEAQAEIRRIIAEQKNDPDNDSKRILEEMKRERLFDIEEDAQTEIDALKWQNTLLTDPNNFVGLYKSDFIKTGFMVADIYADVKLYRELTRRRIERIISFLLSDVDSFIALIERVNESEARYEERMASMSAFAQMFTDQVRGRDILLNPLRRYLVDNHSLVKGYMPFNRDTLVPLVARWVAEKASAWAEGQLLVKSLWTDENLHTLAGLRKFIQNPKLEENLFARRNAYQPDLAGHLQPVKAGSSDGMFSDCKAQVSENVPWSVSKVLTALTLFINPIRGFTKLTALGTANPWLSRVANKCLGLGLPEFIFSDTVRLGFEVVDMGLSAKLYDSINSAKWVSYVLENRDDLLKILYAYRRALTNASSGEDALVKAEQQVREYVEKGHGSSGWLPGSSLSEWWTSRDGGMGRVNKYMRYGAVALMTLKLGFWWLTRETNAAKS